MSHRKSDLGIPCPRKICQSSARARTHEFAFYKRGSVNVRFAPKATEVLRCRELTRCATKRPFGRERRPSFAARLRPSARRGETALFPSVFVSEDGQFVAAAGLK